MKSETNEPRRRIVCLPDSVSSKIAAGEVIERPSSVVKELVENSLDAGAGVIKIELLQGGKGLIRITDNGCGMSREDARICFERHATSKISSEDDLERIETLGFRGEALASIAAVARVVMKTSVSGADHGSLIEIEGGERIREEDAAFPKGTSFEVKDLFYNLPARKKFLRSERAELQRVVKYLLDASLSNPGVRFTLVHAPRTVFDYPAVSDVRERIFQIHGKDAVDRLMKIEFRDNERGLSGMVSRPPSGRGDRKHQFVFINGRPVKDPTVQAALNRAFHGLIERDQSPEAFLFLELSPGELDVNVHPAKSEVRFQDPSSIFQFVYRALHHAALKELGIKEIYPEKAAGDITPPGIHESARPGIPGAPGYGEAGRGPGHRDGLPGSSKPYPPLKYESPPGSTSPSWPQPPSRSRTFPGMEQEPGGGPALFDEPSEVEKHLPKVLGQYMNLYIVAADQDGLMIVDQHNAHERVLYDRYLELDQEKRWPRRLALTPEMMELSPSQEISLAENREFLERAGFRAEDMGGRSFALKEYPDIFKETEAREVFLALIEDVSREKVEIKQHKMLALMACRTAVKAGEPLDRERMEYLVEELLKSSNPALCPHGRPITVRLRKEEIEKGLKR